MFSWIFLKKYCSALCTEDKWVNVDIKHQTIAITLVCRPLTSCITTISVNTTTSTLVEYGVTLEHTKLDKHDRIEIHSQRTEVTICERWYDNPLKTVIWWFHIVVRPRPRKRKRERGKRKTCQFIFTLRKDKKYLAVIQQSVFIHKIAQSPRLKKGLCIF